ncbi:HAMP domain-containing sensor histidine kinase [Nocardioides sp. WV_118_6]
MTPVRARLSRLPLRVRLVAGFSAATFVVLLAAGALVYWRVDYALDRNLDAELEQAASTLTPLVAATGEVTNRDAAAATGVAWQVVDADGLLLDRGGPAGTTPMLSRSQLAEAGTQTRTFNVGDFDILPEAAREPYRVQVAGTPTTPSYHLLVAVRRDHRDEALRELLLQLVVAGIGTLLITAFVGDRLARAALRPVERYRQQAAAIAAGATDLRLDVPPGRDDEVTRLGHTFNDMLAALERALDRERHFVNEASHELRTPITLLAGRIQLARRRRRTPDEHEHVLNELEIDVARLARLADQLLTLGSTAATSAPRETEHSDLAAVAARMVSQRRVADPGRAGDIVLDQLATTVPVALADVEAERILGNLLDNALHHGAAPVQVTVDRPAPGWARLRVADAGPGMAPDLLATATQRFTRAAEARTRPGAGLGLALVAALVERAGGELRLCHDGRHHPSPAPGTPDCDHGPELTVTVLLPAGPAQA